MFKKLFENVSLFALLVSGIILIFSGSLRIGVSTDEPYYLESAENYFQSGWYLPDSYLEEYKDREHENLNLYVYGPVQDIISHKLNVFLGNEDQDLISLSVKAYEIRHLTTTLIFCLLLIFTYLTIYIYTRSFKYSILSVIILLSIPELAGHSMFNQKDVVVAVGVTILTYSLFLLSLEKIIYFYVFGIIGMVLSLGSRPGIWVLVILLIFGYLLLVVIYKKSLFELIKTFFMLIILLFFSIAILQSIYPKLYTDKTALLKNSFSNSQVYWAYHDTLTNGRIEKYPLSARYIPDWIITELPMGLLFLFILASCFLTYLFFLNIFSKHEFPSSALILLLIVQSYSLPVYVVLFNANLYSGLRHILFIFPAIGLLIAVAIIKIDPLIKSEKLKVIFGAGIILYMLFINIEQWRLHPYSYAYVSEIRTLNKVNNNWPTDYWRLSYRELVPKVGTDGLAVCNPFLLVNGQHRGGLLTGWPDSKDNNCKDDLRFNPYLDRLGINSKLNLMNNREFYYIRSNEFGYNIPDNCTRGDEVKRNLRGRKLMMSYVAICKDPVLPQ